MSRVVGISFFVVCTAWVLASASAAAGDPAPALEQARSLESSPLLPTELLHRAAAHGQAAGQTAQIVVVDLEQVRADGTIEFHHRITVEYDQHRNPTGSVAELDHGGDGIDQRITDVLDYGDRDELERRTTGYDFDADGLVDLVQTELLTYDQRGDVVHDAVESTDDSGGTVYYRQITDNTYDPQGHLVLTVLDADLDANGHIDQRTTTTRTYDNGGDLQTEIVEFDNHADGAVESRTTTMWTYDARGNAVLEVSDGSWHTTTTSAYDARGQLVAQVEEIDLNRDGIVDIRNRIENTYDARGNVVRETSDGLGGRSTVTSTYDRRGALIETLRETDADKNGTIDVRFRRSFQYSGSPRRP